VKRLRLRNGYFRDESGSVVYLIGANFWPKRTGPWMYRDAWDPDAVGADLAQLAALGANVARIFCFTPDFMPSTGTVDEGALERLAATIERAAQVGLWSIPTFLVGHMSGENWTAGWALGRDWYTDPMLLDASELLIATVAKRFSGDPRIAAWLLTNEWPLFAGRTSDANGLAWANRLCVALRKADPGCTVSLGDGAWDVLNGQPSGLPSTALRDVVDFFGPHFYPKETDAMRHSAFAGFAMRMLQPLERPILLEEFGCSSDQADDEFAAAYYRTVLWSSFAVGDCGSLAWNSHDFTVADRPPYSHHPYELHFGVIRTDGSQKPQAQELTRFAAFVRKHDPDAWQALDPDVAIGRTSYYLQQFPFDWGWSKPELRDLYLQCYAACTMSGLNAGFVDLGSPVPSALKLLFVPCLQQVTTADAANLERFAHDGGTVYLSYGGEPWFPDLGSFIGARPLIRYGLIAAPPEDTLHLRFARDYGSVQKGAEMRFSVRGELRRCAPRICEPTDAIVLATDEDGNAALLERRLGAGRVVFMAYPLEYYALGGLETNDRHGVWRLYEAIANAAQAQPTVRSADPRVQLFSFTSRDDERLRRIMLVNHGWEALEAGVRGVSSTLTDVESGEPSDPARIRLVAKGVRVMEYSRADKA
jgi:hypothetical protein